jgi:GTP-binding protein
MTNNTKKIITSDGKVEIEVQLDDKNTLDPSDDTVDIIIKINNDELEEDKDSRKYKDIKNIAIIAHVDHGKTTLVDKIIQESLRKHGGGLTADKMGSMDSNALEQQRGITILSKCASISWKDEVSGSWHKINIIDTPGHADFGGEVERILSMADGVVLLVDSAEGVMPQTKYVLAKALKQNLQPLVIVNKIDRQDERATEVLNEIENLFLNLNANDDQLGFHYLFASGRNGWAVDTFAEVTKEGKNLEPFFKKLLHYFKAPVFKESEHFSMAVSMIDYDRYAGRLLIGRIQSGSIKTNAMTSAHHLDGTHVENGRAVKLFQYIGNQRVAVDFATAGDIIIIAGLEKATVSDTICSAGQNIVIKTNPIDPPTMSVVIGVNTSPLAGTEGKKLTSRMIRERLYDEARSNVSIRVKDTDSSESFEVCGRGELQLGVLIENMRREGFELTVAKPQVLFRRDKEDKNRLLEPFEEVVVDTPTDHSGKVIEELSRRKGVMIEMFEFGADTTRIIYHVPSRLLLGFKQDFINMTRGFGVLNKSFLKYDDVVTGCLDEHRKGALISSETGEAVGYAISKLQDRGTMYVKPQDKVYCGMVIGENARNEDMEINVNKGKQLSNVRASGTDEAYGLVPPKVMGLEEMITYINDDECIEVTPCSLRMRKKVLDPTSRKSSERKKDKGAYKVLEDDEMN